ncbi:MAG: YaiO family outer membrane beta-barrel protein [Flavobacteriaceae bacterium]
MLKKKIPTGTKMGAYDAASIRNLSTTSGKGIGNVLKDVLKPYGILLVLVGTTMVVNGQESVAVQNSGHTERAPRNWINLSFSTDVYDQIFDPMYASSIGFEHKARYGSILARMNLNQRFSTTGTQFEIDVYPKIKKGMYAYLNYGYSNDIIFPKHRMGAEVYVGLPKAFEASLGGRSLWFETENVSMITASLGKYSGNWYLVARPYFALRGTGHTGFSFTGNVRKYLKDKFNFWELVLGMGTTPEIWDPGLTDVLYVLYNVDAQFIDLRYQLPLEKWKSRVRFNIGCTRQERIREPNQFLWALNAGFTYMLGV